MEVSQQQEHALVRAAVANIRREWRQLAAWQTCIRQLCQVFINQLTLPQGIHLLHRAWRGRGTILVKAVQAAHCLLFLLLCKLGNRAA